MEMSYKSKLYLYNKIKVEWGAENYLKANLDKGKQSLLAQLRMGVLPIQIELGRYGNTPRDRCICTLYKKKLNVKYISCFAVKPWSMNTVN